MLRPWGIFACSSTWNKPGELLQFPVGALSREREPDGHDRAIQRALHRRPAGVGPLTLSRPREARWRPAGSLRRSFACSGSAPARVSKSNICTASPPRCCRTAAASPCAARHRMAGSRPRSSSSMRAARRSSRSQARSASRVKCVSGEFAWFESATERTPAAVRVVFWALGDDRYYLLDVSSATGDISGVMPLQ